jgi:hypothetical protein
MDLTLTADQAAVAAALDQLAARFASTPTDFHDFALPGQQLEEALQSATQIVYDLHQMFGAMGITLEHSLHLWTYRLKALLSELGGRAGQAHAVSRLCFV